MNEEKEFVIALQSESFELVDNDPKLPENCEWIMCDINSNYEVCSNCDGGFKVAIAADASSKSSFVSFDTSSLGPGVYRIIYEEDGLPCLVSAMHTIVVPSFTVNSHCECYTHMPQSELNFRIDDEPFEQSPESNLSIKICKSTQTSSCVQFIPRIDFIDGNICSHYATISVRLAKSESFERDFVALVPYPLPMNENGTLDTTKLVQESKTGLATYAVASKLQYGCICLVPLWLKGRYVLLKPGKYVAVYFREVKASGFWPLFGGTSSAELVSVSGQLINVVEGDETYEIKSIDDVFRPMLMPANLVEFSDAIESVDDKTKRNMLEKNYLIDVPLRDKILGQKFFEKYVNLYIVIASAYKYSFLHKGNIRKFDLVDYKPPNGASPAQLRRCTTLNTFSKILKGEPTQDSDWSEWHGIEQSAGGTCFQLDRIMQPIGNVYIHGATEAISGYHGRKVHIKPSLQMLVFGKHALSGNILAFCPLSSQLLWISANNVCLSLSK